MYQNIVCPLRRQKGSICLLLVVPHPSSLSKKRIAPLGGVTRWIYSFMPAFLIFLLLSMVPLGSTARTVENRGTDLEAHNERCTLEGFYEYLHAYDKTYSGREEFEKRYEAWLRSCHFVKQYKADHADASFDISLNHLSDRTFEEHKAMFGSGGPPRFNRRRRGEAARKEEKEKTDADPRVTRILQGFRKRNRSSGTTKVDEDMLEGGQDSEFVTQLEPRDLPDLVDWRNPNLNPERINAVTPVKNQGPCGACWAFSSVAAIEGAVAVTTRILNELSNQEMIDCVKQNDGCNGGDFDYAFEFATKGVASSSDYRFVQAQNPTCRSAQYPIASKISNSYETSICSTSGLMNIVAKRPVAVAIDGSCDAFIHYSGGIFTASCGRDLNHAVTIVGYGTEGGTPYWLIKNSWGKMWGNGGFGKVARGVGGCGVSQIEEYGYYAAGGTAYVNGTGFFSDDELAKDPHVGFLDRILKWKYITYVLGIAIALLALPILMSFLRGLKNCCCGSGATKEKRRPQAPIVAVAMEATAAGGAVSSPTARRAGAGGRRTPSPPPHGRSPSKSPGAGVGGAGGKTPPRAGSPTPSSPPPPSSSEWTCSACTFINSPNKRICQICGQYRMASNN